MAPPLPFFALYPTDVSSICRPKTNSNSFEPRQSPRPPLSFPLFTDSRPIPSSLLSLTQRHQRGKTRNLPLKRLRFRRNRPAPRQFATAILSVVCVIYRLGDGRVDGFPIVSALPTRRHKRGVIALADCRRVAGFDLRAAGQGRAAAARRGITRLDRPDRPKN